MQQGTDAHLQLTLWDLISDPSPPTTTPRNDTRDSSGVATLAPVRPTPSVVRPPHVVTRRAVAESATSVRDRYHEIVKLMKKRHRIRECKWRSSNTGCAWQVNYEDGRVSRLIESPYPRGPVSAAVFLHEVGHHAIGFTRYRPRCLEEYKAWEWSLEAMDEFEIKITSRVRDRVTTSLQYAVSKAVRRGIKRLPTELLPYL